MKRLTMHVSNGEKREVTNKKGVTRLITYNTLAYRIKDAAEAMFIMTNFKEDKTKKSEITKWYLSNIK